MIRHPPQETNEQLGRLLRSLVGQSPDKQVSIKLILGVGFEVHVEGDRHRTRMESLNSAVSEALKNRRLVMPEVFLPSLKLGKEICVAQDPRNLKLSKYLDTSHLPPIPEDHDWTAAITSLGMLANDQVGNCTAATAAHIEQCLTANAQGAQIQLTDEQVIEFYASYSGYKPGHPSTDRGATMISMLKAWQKIGIAGHKCGPYVQVNPDHPNEVAAAIYLGGHVAFGLAMPIAWQSQPWDVPADGKLKGDWAPGTWGGHAVPGLRFARAVAATERGVWVATWGIYALVTWAALAAYCDEAYVVFDEDWLKDGKAPNGLLAAELLADFGQLPNAPAPVPAVGLGMKVLPGVCREIYCDTWQIITAEKAKALKASGIAGVIRYTDNLTAQEIQGLLSAGLKIGFVSSCRGTGWVPTSDMGTRDGKAALAKLKSLGVPVGVTVWADVEGSGGTAQDSVAYLEARGKVLETAGYQHGLYEGYGQKATGAQLAALHYTHGYWAALALAEPRPSGIGWNMIQLMPGNQSLAGVIVDMNVVQQDQKGRTPKFAAAV